MTRHGKKVFAALAVTVLPLASCSFLFDPGEYDDELNVGEAGPDLERNVEADAPVFEDVRSSDASDASDASEVLDAGDSSDAVPPRDACAAEAGGDMVPIPNAGYCIDRTEVTVADYRAFVLARGGDFSNQRADCAWNKNYVHTTIPAQGSPQDQLPMRYVDFCDALAFCDWAGKRLCGAIGGGSAYPDAGASTNVDQWYRACSKNNDGLHNFPYGQTFDATRCNVRGDDGGVAPGPVDVGSMPGCEGGYSGIFDMGGNLAEWEDLCQANPDGGPMSCSLRDSDWRDPNRHPCSYFYLQQSTLFQSGIGFRCCSR